MPDPKTPECDHRQWTCHESTRFGFATCLHCNQEIPLPQAINKTMAQVFRYLNASPGHIVPIPVDTVHVDYEKIWTGLRDDCFLRFSCTSFNDLCRETQARFKALVDQGLK